MDPQMWPVVAVAAGIAGILLAIGFARRVLAADPGNERMQEIGAAIREGSVAFIRTQYAWISVFVVAIAVLMYALLPGYGRPWGAIAFVFGAAMSAGAGLVGMRIATAANMRTAEGARQGGVLGALPIAFRGGAVMGFSVAGGGLLAMSLAYLVVVEWLVVDNPFRVLTAVGFGASAIALFARVGGGIFTKAADVGADLVGKIEVGIPEDDPRNPAVIADNVGDNVGDVAGMGADLFESYLGAMVAPIALAAVAFADQPFATHVIVLPLAVAAIGMAASIVGAFMVRLRGNNLAAALRRGTFVAALLTVVGTLAVVSNLFGDVEGVDRPLGLFLAVVIGLVVGLAVGQISEMFTSDHWPPVKRLARQADSGPAILVLTGISDGMRSAAFSVLAVVGGIGGAYWAGSIAFDGGGVYGVAIAAIGLLATVGITVSVDAYGPIADNAGGIAEMAHLPMEVREATDALDSLGNTTAAIAKGFAIGSAAVTALALFVAFTEEAGLATIDVTRVQVTIGLFLGAMFPFLFAALLIKSVGRAANDMIEEVRRQFRDIPGLRAGSDDARPEYGRCVDIATRAALREMVLPGCLAVALPIVVGLVDPEALGGLLAGSLITGFLLAIFMANSGGAWDNAKKFIEAGAYGGKGSDAHTAAVVGDTIGDPFKDTSGPAMNIVIKLMAIVALIFAGAFVG